MKKIFVPGILASLVFLGCQQAPANTSNIGVLTQEVTTPPSAQTQEGRLSLQVLPPTEVSTQASPLEAAQENTARAMGTLEGSMGYPAEGVPPSIEVCADNLSTKETFCTKDRLSGSRYSTLIGYKLQVPAGSYYVYEKITEGTVGSFDSSYKAYYSEYVTCGSKNTCTSHKPVAVEVKAGKTAFDIAPTDWYNL